MGFIAYLLLLVSLVLAAVAWFTEGVAGAVTIGTACLAAILSRIAQAEHHAILQVAQLEALKALAPREPQQ